MAQNWNYGILATPARTIVKTRLNTQSFSFGSKRGTLAHGDLFKKLSYESFFNTELQMDITPLREGDIIWNLPMTQERIPVWSTLKSTTKKKFSKMKHLWITSELS